MKSTRRAPRSATTLTADHGGSNKRRGEPTAEERSGAGEHREELPDSQKWEVGGSPSGIGADDEKRRCQNELRSPEPSHPDDVFN